MFSRLVPVGLAVPLVLAVLLGAGAGCDGSTAEDDDGLTTGDAAFAIRFVARVGEQPLDCTTRYPDLGRPGSNAALRGLRLYVHDVRLVADDGSEVPLALDQDGAFQLEDVALLDFEDGTGTCERGTPEVRQVITGTAPAGAYRGIRFRLGVPFELNHIDVTGAAPPLDQTAMFWGWGEGRFFVNASTTAQDADGEPHVFFFQMGSAGCEGDPRQGDVVSCSYPNRGEVQLDGFSASRDVIVADLAALLAGADLVAGASCSHDSEDDVCASMFTTAGVAFDTGAPSPATQAFFRIGTP